VGVDISPELISRARAIETAQALGISYVAADVTRPATWWDGQLFDGAVCELAFMDIDNLDGTVAVVAQVLRPGGRFLASLVNPCFPGNDVGLSSWPPEGYEAEGYWTSPDHDPEGVRIRVGSNHRKLSTYLNLLIDTGLHLERVVEPGAPLSTWLVLACRNEKRHPWR
jgi:SAM-dependent methyltransferase